MGFSLTDLGDPLGLSSVPGHMNNATGQMGSLGGSVPDWIDPMNNFSASPASPDKDIEAMTKNWALTGQGPSAAQNMVSAERQKNIAAAQSQAKSQAGLGLAAQQRLASEGAAHANVGAAQQGVALRAQEQQDAMKNYQDMYKTQAQAYGDAMRANAEVEAQNAATRGGFLAGGLDALTSFF